MDTLYSKIILDKLMATMSMHVCYLEHVVFGSILVQFVFVIVKDQSFIDLSERKLHVRVVRVLF